MSINTFPYQSRLDFSQLINFWQSNLSELPAQKHHPVREILNNSKLTGALTNDVSEKSLKKYREEIGILLTAIFPPALLEEDMAAVQVPFHDHAFFATPQFSQLMSREKKASGQIAISSADAEFGENCTVIAGLYILKKFYRPELELELPMVVNAVNKETGLEKVYKLEVNTRFADIEVNGELPVLNDNKIEEMLSNLHDHELWLKQLPADRFRFKGFTITRFFDVTGQEMLSSIKYYLLRRDAVTCGTNFQTIQQKIRSLFQMPDLKLGIVFFDEEYNIISNSGLSEWNSFLVSCDCVDLCCESMEGSVYDQVFKTKKSVIIEDLASHPVRSVVENRLIEIGIRNIGIAPLVNSGKILGMLELGSGTPGKLNAMNATKLAKVLPMFTAAIERVLEDLQIEVRALIQRECTSIHPSVEWKFIEEGFKLIRSQNNGTRTEMPEIKFENVYPLFGMSDIRNSSVYRNSSIREDLQANLLAARETLDKLFSHKKMYIFNELNFRIDEALKQIENGLASGDETSILEFLRTEVNATLEFYKSAEPEVERFINKYFEKLDPELGVIYDKRKSFERSLAKINESISAYIDEAEKIAQEIYPHYFEKYKTDGVEYNIYLGESLSRDRKFNPIYLKNFRLWQLVMMTEIARKIDLLQPELTHPLQIAQLILVQNEPLDIRFRKDEKHFDVDGAYNIRYEIIKKRIDKAFVKGSSERLTQPGKISIVYSHEKEAAEYMRYINYLIASNMLVGEVEYLDLEDVQGANGLRALRVTVNSEADENMSSLIRETLSEVLDPVQ